ncbi:MAG: hypothetical protein LBF40_03555 [Deltaproteobacteria bacterium]|jgi:hypothetical protein|nr:hypothetical protein [Deltaproteobacteria bacterium]
MRDGLTLVELLVVVFMSLIVTGVAFSIYRLNASYYYKEDSFLQQSQNLRVALYTITRDVRMAGNGISVLGSSVQLVRAYSPTKETKTGDASPITDTNTTPSWFRYADGTDDGIMGLYGIDGGTVNADTITIFRAEAESGNSLAKVSSDPSGSTLYLSEDLPDKAVLPLDIIAVANGSDAVLLQVDDSFVEGSNEIPIKLNGRFTPSTLSFGFPFTFAGAYLYNFRDVSFVTYYVDQTKNQLMADYHDNGRTGWDDTARQSFIVAYNIEDMQIYYFYNEDTVDMAALTTTPDVSFARLEKDPVKAVTVGLTSKAPYGEGPCTQQRPRLFNRLQDHPGMTSPNCSILDNHPRSVLVQTVFLRNFQRIALP